MAESNGNRGLWACFIIAALLAVVFLVLWVMRGEDVDKLTADLRSANAERQRLDGEARNAARDLDSARERLASVESAQRNDAERVSAAERQARSVQADLDIANRRIADATAEVNRLKNAGAGEIAALKEALAKAKSEIESSMASHADELARARTDADSSRNRADESEGLRERLAALQEDFDAARNEAEAFRKRFADAERAAAAAARDAVRLEDARTNLSDELKAAREEAATLAARVAGGANGEKMQNALTELKERLAADAAERENDLRTEIDRLQKRIESDSAAAENAAAAKLAENERAAAERKAKTEAAERAKLQTAMDALAASLAASEKTGRAWRDRAGAAEAKLAEANAAAAMAEAAVKSGQAGMEKLRARVAEAATDQARAEQAFLAREKELAEKGRRDIAERDGKIANLELSLHNIVGDTWFGLSGPIRSSGRLAKRPDGFFIDKGTRQNVRPGMKFDVYRPVGDRNRYVGMVQVTDARENMSLVRPIENWGEHPVCSVTGLAVLEPGAKHSPFAVDAAGRPAPLVKSGAIGIPTEDPADGDLIDSPFFRPERKLNFAIGPNVPDQALASRLVTLLGGSVALGGAAAGADFEIVSEGAAAQAVSSADPGPRRIGIEYLVRYLGVSLPASVAVCCQ